MQRFAQRLHLTSRKRVSDGADTSASEGFSRKAEQLAGSEKVALLQLVSACKKGDRTAQRKLYDALAGKMFAVCLRYMGNRDDAQDMFQEGFITLFSKLDSYSGEGSFEGWARKIFVNTALMSLRKNDALKLSDPLETAWDVSAETTTQLQNIGYQELLALVASLPDGYRTVFNLSVIEGYSHKEIAQQLGITEATSRSQLQRARMLLQDKIKRM